MTVERIGVTFNITFENNEVSVVQKVVEQRYLRCLLNCMLSEEYS